MEFAILFDCAIESEADYFGIKSSKVWSQNGLTSNTEALSNLSGLTAKLLAGALRQVQRLFNSLPSLCLERIIGNSSIAVRFNDTNETTIIRLSYDYHSKTSPQSCKVFRRFRLSTLPFSAKWLYTYYLTVPHSTPTAPFVTLRQSSVYLAGSIATWECQIIFIHEQKSC